MRHPCSCIVVAELRHRAVRHATRRRAKEAVNCAIQMRGGTTRRCQAIRDLVTNNFWSKHTCCCRTLPHCCFARSHCLRHLPTPSMQTWKRFPAAPSPALAGTPYIIAMCCCLMQRMPEAGGRACGRNTRARGAGRRSHAGDPQMKHNEVVNARSALSRLRLTSPMMSPFLLMSSTV